jgi:hypothetical protein
VPAAFNLSDFNINFKQFFTIISGIQWIERIEITREFPSLPPSASQLLAFEIIKSRNEAETENEKGLSLKIGT